MLKLTGMCIRKLMEKYPYNDWEKVVKEVAEKILDEDEWKMTHYEIEDLLMEESGLM